jgi:hypothetical protein
MSVLEEPLTIIINSKLKNIAIILKYYYTISNASIVIFPRAGCLNADRLSIPCDKFPPWGWCTDVQVKIDAILLSKFRTRLKNLHRQLCYRTTQNMVPCNITSKHIHIISSKMPLRYQTSYNV